MVSERKEGDCADPSSRVYGLQDSVPTKAIEACHNLASVIELKMFSPRNIRSAATNQSQKAFTDTEGKLVVESNDIYGELETTGDIILAWNTLDCVWQKIHPEWPVAKIGIRVCFNMKLFGHCGNKAQLVMIEFSNRFLASNSSRVANKRGPLSYEKAWNLAGSTCFNAGYEREPPAVRSLPAGRISAIPGGGRGAGRGGGARGGRGGGGATRLNDGRFNLKTKDGSLICFWFQSGTCHDQKDQYCKRKEGQLKHVCGYQKSGGEICAGSHPKVEHDITKHCN